jgi:hypothetical protein
MEEKMNQDRRPRWRDPGRASQQPVLVGGRRGADQRRHPQGVRVREYAQWQGGAHQDQALRGLMSPGLLRQPGGFEPESEGKD